jgi:NIPSNAP
MPVQLRVYEIEPGRVRQFAEEWQASVVPLRHKLGFQVLGAWLSAADDVFAWLVSHDGDFAAADDAYYASDERTGLDPDPARLVTRILATTTVEPLDL